MLQLCSPFCYSLAVTARGDIPSAERERLQEAARGADDAAAELKAAVRAAWLAGASIRAIATELRKSTRTIQNWLEGVRHDAPSLES